MSSIKCYDNAGAWMKHLYQWDAEQVVKISGVDAGVELEVQFCSIDSTEALVVPHNVDGADITARVPNILLQRPVPIMVYVCRISNDGASQTIGAARITVVPKAKPVDYIYTDTEVLSYRTLEAQMNELQNNIDLMENKIPTTLPNPCSLTINGQSYDGSSPVNISVESNIQGGDMTSADAIKLAIDAYMSEHPINFEEADPTVPLLAKQPAKPTYTAEEVGAMPKDTAIPTVPDALPNPHKLVITGAVSAEYDGSEAVAVEIPVGESSQQNKREWELFQSITMEEETSGWIIGSVDSLENAFSAKQYTEILLNFGAFVPPTSGGTATFSIQVNNNGGGRNGVIKNLLSTSGNSYFSVHIQRTGPAWSKVTAAEDGAYASKYGIVFCPTQDKELCKGSYIAYVRIITTMGEGTVITIYGR